MTLVSGREIAEHGLPSVDRLTAMAGGHRWVDQQWLAQVIFYQASRIGLGLVVALYLAAIAIAYGICALTARRRGASARMILVFFVVAVAAAPWGLQIRAQALALPFFAMTLWLLSRDPDFERASTLWVLSLLGVWANVHGSVTLGVLLVFLTGLQAVIRRGLTLRRAACVVLAPLCVFASPYALRLPGYYWLMLVDPPFGRQISEWQRTVPSATTAVFFVLAATAIFLIVTRRRRVAWFDLACIAVTLAGALAAVRGIVWFNLAALAIVTPLASRKNARFEGKTASVLAAVALAVAAGTIVFSATRPDGAYDSRLPAAAIDAVGQETASRVLADPRTADWLLWHIPALRGHLAYDVRFELLTPREFAVVSAFYKAGPGWATAARGYSLVVDTPAHVTRLVRAGGWRQLYTDAQVAIAIRTNSA